MTPDRTGSTSAFSYSALSPEDADAARLAAERIRTRLRASVIEIGRDLIAIKARLEHGQFAAWVEQELQIEARCSQNYMRAAGFLADKSESLSLLPPTILYALSSPKAPAAIVQEVVEAAEAGSPIAPDVLRLRLDEAKARRVQEAEERQRQRQEAEGVRIELTRLRINHPGASDEELAGLAKKRRAAHARRGETGRRLRQEAEIAERALAEEQERLRVERFQPLADRIADALGDDLPVLRAALENWADAACLRRLLARSDDLREGRRQLRQELPL